MTRLQIDLPMHESVQHVISHCRDRDRKEIRAVCGDYDPTRLTHALMAGWSAGGAYGAVFSLAGQPVAFLFALQETPRCLNVSLMATDRFNEITIPVTRHVKRHVVPDLMGRGFLRAECRCWEGHTDARRWLSICGATEEAVIPGYGMDGETFIQMAWRADHVRKATEDKDASEHHRHGRQGTAGQVTASSSAWLS